MKKKTCQYLSALLLLSVIWYATPTSAVDTETTLSPDTEHAKVKRVPLDDGVEMEFAYVGPDSFNMGNKEKKFKKERPLHKVQIAKPLWMGRYEVTLDEYRKFMKFEGNGEGMDWDADYCPYKKQSGYPLSGNKLSRVARQPVVEVSWHDAVAFCEWLTERERKSKRLPQGYEYRLPTEAEWEYAARGGHKSSKDLEFAGSDNIGSVAWYRDNSNGKSHPVGKLKPNELGLYDMSGNVWEWCLDYWHGNYNGAPTDGSVWRSGGDSSRRILRSGSWYCKYWLSRSTFRYAHYPAGTSHCVGFRVVLAPSISE